MDKSIESTMKKQRDFLVKKTNEIRKIDKEKRELRDKL
jgi:hypothetical protein